MPFITGVQYSGVPVGTIISISGANAPPRTLLCNGDAIPNGVGTVQGITANFSSLFSILSTTYGLAGTLPDFRGIFPRGVGSQNRYVFIMQTLGGVGPFAATSGAVYSNNGQSFTVLNNRPLTGGGILTTRGTGAPQPGPFGQLTRVSGTGTNIIWYTSVQSVTYSTSLGVYYTDQFQGHWHNINRSDTVGVSGANITNGPGSVSADTYVKNAVTDGTNGTPRTGTETAPASLGINYCIAF